MPNHFLKTSIHPLAELKPNLHLCNSALLLRISHGKGALTSNSSMLCFNGEPLIHYGADSCGTCAGFVAAGYGIDRIGDSQLKQISRDMNDDFVDLSTSARKMAPLLSLLTDGHYVLADMNLFPTDGDKNYFWGTWNWICRTFKQNHTYTRLFPLYGCSPAFLFASESRNAFREERVQTYMKQLQESQETFPRAVAYYIGGSGSVLLDGHHKAAAAAALGESVRCIVICRARVEGKTLTDALARKSRLLLNTSNGSDGETIMRTLSGHYFDSVFQIISADRKEVLGQLEGCIAQNDFPVSAYVPPEEKEEEFLIPEQYTRHVKDYPDLDEFCEALWIAPNKIDAEYTKCLEQIQKIKPRDDYFEKRLFYVKNYLDVFRDERRSSFEKLFMEHVQSCLITGPDCISIISDS